MDAAEQVTCPRCGGAGEVPVSFVPRSLSYPDGVRETDGCPECDGGGGVPVWFAAALAAEEEAR